MQLTEIYTITYRTVNSLEKLHLRSKKIFKRLKGSQYTPSQSCIPISFSVKFKFKVFYSAKNKVWNTKKNNFQSLGCLMDEVNMQKNLNIMQWSRLCDYSSYDVLNTRYCKCHSWPSFFLRFRRTINHAKYCKSAWLRTAPLGFKEKRSYQSEILSINYITFS